MNKVGIHVSIQVLKSLGNIVGSRLYNVTRKYGQFTKSHPEWQLFLAYTPHQ